MVRYERIVEARYSVEATVPVHAPFGRQHMQVGMEVEAGAKGLYDDDDSGHEI